jgi:hypothetical protein
MPARLFALDQGFPLPIVSSLREWFEAEADMVPLSDVDVRLTSEVDDWEILLALHHHPDPWDGLITTDSGMLHLPRELAALMQTKLTLVDCLAVGHDPVRATGLLLTNLSSVCEQTRPDRAQVWALGGGRKRPPADPWDYFTRIAEHRNVSTGDLRQEAWLSPEELAADPLAE